MQTIRISDGILADDLGPSMQVPSINKGSSLVTHRVVSDNHDMPNADEADVSVCPKPPIAVSGHGNYIVLGDERRILDACGGAGVSCIGHGNQEVIEAIVSQALKISYVPWGFFENNAKLALSNWFSSTSNGHFKKTYIACSGSEAVEGAMKLARESFVWKGQLQRVNFISREESYHGITLGSLSLGGHMSRRAPFEELLLPKVHRISACNPYRQRFVGETDISYVARKAEELERMFQQLGPDTVIAFIAEPVVGAASGCTPSVPGYFQAVKSVCDRHGALFILDEVMCGMGRTGTIHAWEQEGVLPDIQTVGKGLSGGYQPVSAVLVGPKIYEQMEAKNVTFTHGHTYQDHPLGCAAALKVQEIIHKGNLIANVRRRGQDLENLLKQKLGNHPNVGDIRGRGLFWGIEFVKDKRSKIPFSPGLQVAQRVHKVAMAAPHDMAIYFGQGCAGNRKGDHVMIMPAYNIDSNTILTIVERLVSAVQQVFADMSE